MRVSLFAAALIVVAVPFGFLLDQVVRDGPFLEVDTWAAGHLHEVVRESPAAVDGLQVISALGKPVWLYLLCLPIGLWLLRRRRARLAVYLVATTLLGGVIDTWVKLAVGRDRPSFDSPVATALGKSFPSGHAMVSTVAYGAFLLVFLPVVPPPRRRLVVVMTALLVAGIGFSRLALGVHYVSDVLGGIALGGAWLALSTAAFEIWREDRGLRRTRPLAEGAEPRTWTV